jgi:hypothetical protein
MCAVRVRVPLAAANLPPPTIDMTRILADMRRHRKSEPESQLSVVNVDSAVGLDETYRCPVGL